MGRPASISSIYYIYLFYHVTLCLLCLLYLFPSISSILSDVGFLSQVIAEEQNKPLELEAETYRILMGKEALEREAHALKTRDRHEKIVKLKDELQVRCVYDDLM